MRPRRWRSLRVGFRRDVNRAAAARAQALTGGDVARGKILARELGCVACHVMPGVRGPRSSVGPPLGTFGGRSFVGGAVDNTPEHVMRFIRDPRAVAREGGGGAGSGGVFVFVAVTGSGGGRAREPTVGATAMTTLPEEFLEKRERTGLVVEGGGTVAVERRTHAEIKTFGVGIADDLEAGGAGLASELLRVLEERPTDAAVHGGRENPKMIKDGVRGVGELERVETEDGAVAAGDEGGMRSDVVRRQRERGPPKLEPRGRVTPVGLGGVGDAREGDGIFGAGARDLEHGGRMDDGGSELKPAR